VIRHTALAIAALTVAMVPLGVAAAQPVPDPANRMRLEVDTLSPRVVTAGTAEVTVTGRVTNTGDRPINNVRVQLRRGEALNTEQKVRELRGQATDSAMSTFVQMSGKLEPGQSAPIALTVPVRGTDTSLRIDQPGVYPLLVNVNGQPDYGNQARLAASYLALPVLSVPSGPTAPKPPNPARLTILWPLVDDYPRRVPSPDEHALLSDDGLAGSLAPGGRLFELVSAATQAVTTDPDLLDTLCFAVDPDLLETVQQMTAGYRYRDDAGQLVTGSGAEAAKTWLAALQGLVTGRCVIAVPYADADLVALSRANAAGLERLALTSGGAVTELLRPYPPAPSILWPAGGTLDQRTLLDLAGTTPTTVLMDPAHLHNRQGVGPYTVGGSTGPGAARVLPIDNLASLTLEDDPTSQTSQTAQAGLAALIYETAFAPANGRSILITPPRRWHAPAGELGVYLQTVQQLFTADLARPQPLTDAAAAVPGGTVGELDYTAQDGAAEITPAATAAAVRVNAAQGDLVDSMHVDDTAQVKPAVLVDPLRYGLLRGTSTAWRGHPDQAARAVDEVAGQLDALRSQVTIDNPGRPLTLASGNSPIPVLINNALPVSITVRIKLGDTPGLRPESIPDVIIPARLAVNRYLPAEVIRSGRFTVDVSLSTPGGTPLGSTARIELSSTSYGTVTLIITGTAAAVLFLLVGLRIYRRVKTARAAGPPAEDGAS
jgi:hypothetical protein